MKESNFCANFILIRGIWTMTRKQMGQLLSCSENQIGGYERGSTAATPSVLFDLENLTGIAAKSLYYDALTRSSIPNEPLRPTTELAPPQYDAQNLSLAERVKRLEMKVFGT